MTGSLAVELVNTVWAPRGAVEDRLADWLRERELPDSQGFRALRDATRAAAAAVVAGGPAPDGPLAEINSAAELAPRWPRIDGDFAVTEVTAAEPAAAALAELARSAIDLLSGPDRERLRRCQNPRCILYFVKDHPRRRSCSTACAARARVARHYQRHHTAPPADDLNDTGR